MDTIIKINKHDFLASGGTINVHEYVSHLDDGQAMHVCERYCTLLGQTVLDAHVTGATLLFAPAYPNTWTDHFKQHGLGLNEHFNVTNQFPH